MKKNMIRSFILISMLATGVAKADHGWAVYFAQCDTRDAVDSTGFGTSLAYEIVPTAQNAPGNRLAHTAQANKSNLHD